MSLILNIETSSSNCSASISEYENILAIQEENFDKFSHSKFLHVFIEKLFKKIKKTPKDLSAVSVSSGPGSYTGLRIGVSSAKGICFALNIPLISVDTMQILASKANQQVGYIISAMDARRDEIYYSVFEANNIEIPKKITKTDSLILSSNSFLDFSKLSKVYFIGNCNEKIAKFINHENILYSDFTLPSALDMAKLSYLKFDKKDFENLSEFQPRYLKDFEGKKTN